ncbi:MAG: hypothetical protein SGJ20_15955 [Planctomycetota bacterium]|nr:hypothetical protein [Planctomycetota bacterium]
MPILRCFATVIGAIFFSGLLAAEVNAQIPSYRPSRPVVSPYINLLQRGGGPLPNYFTYVRPILDQNIVNQQQQTAIMQNQRTMQQMEGQVLRMQESNARPTGAAGPAGFMNHTQFFSNYSRPASR